MLGECQAGDGAAFFGVFERVAVLDRNAGKFSLHRINNGSWGAALASMGATINDSTEYTLKVERKQRQVTVSVPSFGTSFTHNAIGDLGTGYSGLYSDKTDVTFDDFTAHDATSRDPLTPRIGGLAEASLESGELRIYGNVLVYRGGEAIVENFFDDNYMVQVDVTPGVAGSFSIWFRYIDANNGYRLYCDSARKTKLYSYFIICSVITL